MSSLTKLTLAALLAAFVGSGCCLTSPCLTTSCGAVGGGCNIPTEPSCGAAGCDSCAVSCRPGGCLGLGCIGKLFSITNYGCTGCAGGGCGGGYYHDWISDPPCADPCDGCGQFTGIASGGVCGNCTGGGAPTCGAPEPTCAAPCGEPTCAAPTCGAPAPTYAAEPTCGVADCTDCGTAPMMVAAEPTCGLADAGCDGGCDGACGSGGGGSGSGGLLGRYGNRGGFKLPGRAIYSTLGGVGGFFRELGRGLMPAHGSCNAFTGYAGGGGCGSCGSCDACIVEPDCGIAEPSCGCVGSATCGSCQLVSVPVQVQASQVTRVQRPTQQMQRIVQPAQQVTRGVATHRVGSGAVAQSRIPHEVVTRQIRTAHNRPPHKVVSKHLR